ncbi:MAG: hypothetical protein AB1500_03610 [Bacillota bacterium]
MVPQSKAGVKARLKLQGCLMLAAGVLGVLDLLFCWIPKVIPYRRSKPQGRMVFRVRR